MIETDDFALFVRTSGENVRRALVASYGVEIGTEAAAHALAMAWERWAHVARMPNAAGWLFRCGQSKARPHVRWSRRRSSFPVKELNAVASVDSSLVHILDALAHLSRGQRAAVILVKCHGFSYMEAAELLGVTEAAVTNHVHRGLARLRDLLEES